MQGCFCDGRADFALLSNPGNKKGPPFGEPLLVLRMVRHQESNRITIDLKINGLR